MNAFAHPGGTPAAPPRAAASTRRSGFTLIEAIVVMAIVAIIATLLVPNLIQFIHRSRFEGFVRQAQSVVNLAKLEAIRRGTPVVVWIDDTAAPRQITVFADVHGDAITDAPDPETDDPAYDPEPDQPRGTTDYIVGGPMSIPADISLTAPGEYEAYDGLTDVTPVAGVNRKAIVFQSDGSVLDTGAFSFGDEPGNFLQLLVAPSATARVSILKYNEDDDEWYEFGEGGEHWTWK